MSHNQVQAACYLWFHNEYPGERSMLLHVDNNSVNAVIGAQKKALGVVKGVSDFIFIVAGCVIFMELKVGRDVQKPEQLDFMNKVKERGHEYIIFHSLEQFKEIIWQNIGKS